MAICWETPNLFKIGQKYIAIYMEAWGRIIAAGDIKSL
jgi:hypothetical protein